MRSANLLRSALPIAAAGAVAIALGGVHEASHTAVVVTTWMVLAWLMSPLHPSLTGLLGCFLFWASGAGEIEEAFGGFGLPMPWAIYGLLILAAAARYSGLEARLGRLLPRSTGGATAGLLALAVVLSVLIPSAVGKVFVLALVALGATGAGGTVLDGRLAAPLVAVGSYAAVALDRSLLPPPAALIAWIAAVCAACAVVAARLVGRDRIRAIDDVSAIAHMDLALEWRVAILVGATVAAWISTPWHGLPPTVVGLAAGLIACLPVIGPLAPHKALSPDPLAIIFVGTALSVPVVLAESDALAIVAGAAAAAAHALSAVVPGTLATYWAGVLYHLFVPDGGAADALGAVAQAAGTDPALAGTAWASSAATRFALYQSPAFILAASIGALRSRDLLRLGAATVVLGSIVVLFL